MPETEKVKFIIEIDEHGRPVIRQTEGDFDRLERSAKKTGGTFNTLKSHWLALSAALAAGIYTVISLAKSFTQAAGESESFRAQLIGVSDSAEEATQAYSEMLDFAARTPHMTQDVVAAFVQLKSVGLDPTTAGMKTLGDVAFLFNRNIQDVGSALISFEKEVLRRLGIEIDRTGEKVKIMSGDMIVETENAADAIRAGLLQVWETRFGGAMKTAESTWRGVKALFVSAVWEMRQSLGNVLLPGLKFITQQMTNVIFRIRDWAKNHSVAVQDMVKNGLWLILDGLKLVTYAIQGVGYAWLGWRSKVALVKVAVARFVEFIIDIFRTWMEKFNFGGMLDGLIEKLTEASAGVSVFADDATKDLADLAKKQAESFSWWAKIRGAISDIGAELEIQWPKLTQLTTAPPGGEGGGGGGPPTDQAAAIAAAEQKLLLQQQLAEAEFYNSEAETIAHENRMTAWDQEIQKTDEMITSYNMLGDALNQLTSKEQLYADMKSVTKNAIASAILGYEKFSVAIKKATAQLLAQIAAEAAIRALLHTAMGIAALTPWGMAMYGPAPLHFKSAAIFGAIAVAAGAAAKSMMASAGGVSNAERTGYQEDRGAGVQDLAREAEPREYAQKWEVTILHPIGTGEWVEDNLIPELKKVAKRDTEITVTYA